MEAQRLRQELTHIGRVSTIGELTASLAHELTQPLTAILHNAQAAQRTLKAGAVNLEEIREILADIVDDDRRAGEVIHRLRDLLKKGTLEFATLDVNEMMTEMTRLVSSEAALRNVSVRLELAPLLPPVRGDRVQLQQVILNLVLNGLDAMPEQVTGVRTLVLRSAKDSSTTIRVAVQDSGPGIDEADLDDIFQAFYTTKADGLGMGLAIARSIVEAHGGQLEARNNPRAGRHFPSRCPSASPSVMSAPAAPLVFVVDDDPSVRKSLARLIATAGYKVETFASAREFLARPLPAGEGGPGCLVLDVRMPGLTGLALQEALTTAGHRLSIVFITGHGDVATTVKAMKGGAVDFLTKPVNDHALLSAIERAVSRARQLWQEQAKITELQDRIKTLTPRETEVFALVVTGMLNKQIASDLGVSEKMVKVHRGRVMQKMRAGSLAELVRLADQGGVIAATP